MTPFYLMQSFGAGQDFAKLSMVLIGAFVHLFELLQNYVNRKMIFNGAL